VDALDVLPAISFIGAQRLGWCLDFHFVAGAGIRSRVDHSRLFGKQNGDDAEIPAADLGRFPGVKLGVARANCSPLEG